MGYSHDSYGRTPRPVSFRSYRLVCGQMNRLTKFVKGALIGCEGSVRFAAGTPSTGLVRAREKTDAFVQNSIDIYPDPT